MNRLLAAAAEVQAFCVAGDLRFAFLGGLAVQRWGEARATRNADLSVIAGPAGEAQVIDAFLDRFTERMPDARAFARANRVLLLRSADGIPIDVALGSLPFETRAVEDARDEEVVDGVPLRLVRPSALIVYKVFAGRPIGRDVEGIVARSGTLVDWDSVRADLEELLPAKADTTSLARLEALRAGIAGR